ncbi:MAG: sensor histidine kinase [Candidatus Krumholzibacteriia bacterium]
MADEHDRIDEQSSHFVSAASLRVRLDWFNKLRWGAAGCILLATLLADRVIDNELVQAPLLGVVGVLLVLNLAYVVRNRRVPPRNIRVELRHVKMQMVGDLVALTVFLNLSGGIENPLLYMYILHVIIASLLFKGREIFQIAWLAIVLFTADVAGEYFGFLPHHHLHSVGDLTHEVPFILMTLASFYLVLLFSAYIGASIMKHNRAIKDELVVRQQALIAADRAKMDFFRFVTHEIKSPVSTAQSAVETALELGAARMAPAVEDMLSRAVGRLELAGEMVRNLADFTRGGDLGAENMGEVDLNRLIARTAEDLHELASRRRITFELDLPGSPVTVVSSRSMLEKIIQNLASNAVRYNRDGGQVRIALKSADGGLKLEVADQGIGIDPADQDRIFEEFYRTPAAQEMTNMGTGLGLPIVRKFVKQLGGQVSLHSAPGRGSTFTVTLPFPSSGGERAGEGPPPRSPSVSAEAGS